MEMHGLQITLLFRKAVQTTWHEKGLSVEEYFDLDAGEQADMNSVPRHNHALDYIGLSASEMQNTRLEIVDHTSQSRRVITETFWNAGNNRVIERVDNLADSSYWELIVESKIEEPDVWEILRFGRQEDVVVPLYQGFFVDHDDGTEKEIKIHP